MAVRSELRFFLIAAIAQSALRVVRLSQMDWRETDTPFYFSVVQLAGEGKYPFLDFWMEYPPLFPAMLVGAQAALGLFGEVSAFAFLRLFVVFFGIVDLANLMLVHRIGSLCNGWRRARWSLLLYAASPIPVWFSTGYFDCLAVLWLLGGLWWLLRGQAGLAGVLGGLGILTKVFPGVLLVAAPFVLPVRGSVRMVLACLATVALGLTPLALARPEMLMASATVSASRPPWETIWAVLVRDYRWGALPDLDERFHPASALIDAGAYSALQPLVLTWQVAIMMATGWILFRRLAHQRRDARVALTAVTLALTGLLLANKGFSPQYLEWVLPLVFLVWPNRIGLCYALAFTAYFAFYYVVYTPTSLQFHVAGTASIDRMAAVAWLSVLTRTVLLGTLYAHLVHPGRLAVGDHRATLRSTAGR